MDQTLSLCLGDPLDRFFMRLFRIKPEGSPRTLARAFFLMAITWLPQAGMSAIHGSFIGGAAPFLFDFAAIVQYLVTVPLLVLADKITGPFVDSAIRHFIDSGLLNQPEARRYEETVRHTLRILKSGWVDFVLLIAGMGFAWTWILPSLAMAQSNPAFESWQIIRTASGPHLSLAVLYAGMVAGPVFLYSHFRWVLKVIVWIWLLIVVSRMKLRINPCHPDKSGGIYFLSRVQSAFGIQIFAIGCEIAATVGYNIAVEGGSMFSLDSWILWVPFVVMAPLAFMLPLLLFSRRLFWAKNIGLFEMSRFSNDFTSAFGQRHLGYTAPLALESRTVLASGEVQTYLDGISGDVQSLADLQNSFDAVRSMKILPFDFASLGKLVLAAASPMAPLFLDSVPSIKTVLEFVTGLI
jgi:hypothetical protein